MEENSFHTGRKIFRKRPLSIIQTHRMRGKSRLTLYCLKLYYNSFQLLVGTDWPVESQSRSLGFQTKWWWWWWWMELSSRRAFMCVFIEEDAHWPPVCLCIVLLSIPSVPFLLHTFFPHSLLYTGTAPSSPSPSVMLFTTYVCFCVYLSSLLPIFFVKCKDSKINK